MRRGALIVVILPVLHAHALSAQRSDSASVGCPVVSGLVATVTTNESPDSGVARAPRDTTAARAPLLQLDARHVIDTTWRFNIADRRWTRSYFAASVGAGWADGFGSGTAAGTTTAPDSAGRAGSHRWSACVGASIGMRDPTLVLHGARGVVHLRADVRPLARAGQAGDTTGQLRRLP